MIDTYKTFRDNALLSSQMNGLLEALKFPLRLSLSLIRLIIVSSWLTWRLRSISLSCCAGMGTSLKRRRRKALGEIFSLVRVNGFSSLF
jgi:hypothetical protein